MTNLSQLLGICQNQRMCETNSCNITPYVLEHSIIDIAGGQVYIIKQFWIKTGNIVKTKHNKYIKL